MAIRPTFFKRERIGATTMAQRQLTMVGLGSFVKGNKDLSIFRAPVGGARIRAIRVCMGCRQIAAINEADTWTYNALKGVATNASSLHTHAVSLSDVTLFATQFKSLSLSRGNCTLTSGEVLMLRMKISGSPSGVRQGVVAVEWDRVTNI